MWTNCKSSNLRQHMSYNCLKNISLHDLCFVMHKRTVIFFILEQNVYLNQQGRTRHGLNHSKHSIFIEYLYICMINRHYIRKKTKQNMRKKICEQYCTLFLKCFRSHHQLNILAPAFLIIRSGF